MKNIIINVLRELAGLFVDDGLFALAIGAIVVLTAIVAQAEPLAAGLVLLAGCLGLLVGNTAKAGKRRRP